MIKIQKLILKNDLQESFFFTIIHLFVLFEEVTGGVKSI